MRVCMRACVRMCTCVHVCACVCVRPLLNGVVYPQAVNITPSAPVGWLDAAHRKEFITLRWFDRAQSACDLSRCVSVSLCVSVSPPPPFPPPPPSLWCIFGHAYTRMGNRLDCATTDLSNGRGFQRENCTQHTLWQHTRDPPNTHTHTRPNEAPHHAHVTVWPCTTTHQTVLRLLTSVARVRSGGKIAIFSNLEEANNCNPPSVNDVNSLALAMFDEPWWIQVSHSDHLAFSVSSTLVTLKTNKHCFC